MAADLASSLCEWLHLIEEFDRKRGWEEAGLQSCAAWLSWTCSVAPGTAREYVRIARVLPLLPLVDAAFAAGRLSYSKVRILAQVASEVDEEVLLDQALVQTCSQLERTVRSYRRTDGWSQQRKRRVVWRWDDDGMLVMTTRLPADEGAILVAAMECSSDDVVRAPEESCSDAVGDDGDGSSGDGSSGDGSSGDGSSGDDGSGDANPSGGDAAGEVERRQMPWPTATDRQRAALTGADPLGTVGADMLVALAHRALAAGNVDSSGDDRHLLILHADLDQLIGGAESAQPVESTERPVESAERPVESAERPADSEDEPTESDAESAECRDAPAETRDAHDEPCAKVGAEAVPVAEPGTEQAPDVGRVHQQTRRQSGRHTASGTILARARCHLENGPGVDRRTAQRIACDAALVAVLHHVGEGEPLRLGRKTRAISPAQRRALRIRDGGCRFPGCHRRGHLEAHHVQHWSLLGPTDLENLVLLCRHHHMLMHEGGFRVSPGSDGWEFHNPRGALVAVAPSLPGSSDGCGPPRRVPDPMGLLPGWGGEPFHLAETVAVLTRFPRGGG